MSSDQRALVQRLQGSPPSVGSVVAVGIDQKALVQRLWDFCNVLRDDGLSYGDYVEQLTYLLFLKMADEQHELLGGERVVPIEHDWQSLLNRSGAELEEHYSKTLEELGAADNMLGALISAIVDVMQPQPDDRICDPACGTGGFFLGAYRSIIDRFTPLEPEQIARLRSGGAFTGWELADLPARLCAMNLLLHGIESPESDSPVHVDDALRADPGQRFDMVLTNPPFGSSASDSYEREDFWAVTRNKQLNFVQHVVSLLKVGGSAAVVVPDNVLFESGAGETIRRRLLHDCEVHTLLRLPTGIFYAQGVKANVLFFRRREGAEQAWTRELWVYDLRTNKHFTLKQNPLTRADLDDFVACYKPSELHKRQPSERFKRYSYGELMARDKVSLDLFWLRDDSLTDIDNLPPPAALVAEINEDLESALSEIRALTEALSPNSDAPTPAPR